MPPPLALALTLLFIAYLFGREFRQPYKPSLALWIPCIWLLILGSRAVSAWLNLGQPVPEDFHIEDGSPLDRIVFVLMMVAGLIVLVKRRIVWSQVFRNNVALTVFFVYCGLSIFWSDFPFVAFKRWTKGFGDPIMMLIILTEHEPIKAVERVIKTCAYMLIPLSVLFIKYYPDFGKAYDSWTGDAFYTGVATNKNLLGFVLMICGLFLVWRISARPRAGDKHQSWLDDIGIPIVLLGMIGWLFLMANSKTSLMGFILATVLFFLLGRQNVRKHFGFYVFAGVCMFVLLEASVSITNLLIQSAGRDSTLSGRTELWEVVLRTDPKPMFGHGFESFWLGDRLKVLQDMWDYKPTMAHNGYIELYLNLGWFGLFCLTGVIASCYMKLRETLTSSSEMTETVMFARFGMAFLAAFLAYNYTEAAFKSLHLLFAIFLLFTIKAPKPQKQAAEPYPFVLPKRAEKLSRATSVGNMSSAR
jgi:exopolysaccharide production protein ExoQ